MSKNDIYLEAYGEKIAVVQSYTSKHIGNIWELTLYNVYTTDYSLMNNIERVKVKDVSFVVQHQSKKQIKYSCLSLVSDDYINIDFYTERLELVAAERIEEDAV